MNVLLISQCSKRALTETRRILDQFAERRGERTWQTAITQAGLDTLRKLLRKTARKNTAVACHWIRGKDHSELLWIVGDAGQFNYEGAVPTNTTVHDVLRREGENDWHSLRVIRQIAALAALLHDLGKACQAFQERLRHLGRIEKNRYRHEWVSLRLFQAFVGQDTDEAWLQRLVDGAGDEVDARGFEACWLDHAAGRLLRDGLDAAAAGNKPFASGGTGLPPLAQVVAWLVLTHHRLPAMPRGLAEGDGGIQWHGQPLRGIPGAVLNTLLGKIDADWNEPWAGSPGARDRARIAPCWNFPEGLPVRTALWRKRAARIAKDILKSLPAATSHGLGNTFVMHIARLSLMLGDHYYSSLKLIGQRVQGEKDFPLFANTDRANGALLQRLDEHLLGVESHTSQLVHALPSLGRQLPHLIGHRGLKRRSGDARFRWQDKAADLAVGVRRRSAEHGAFIVNMASTGCGKTLGNARIMNALAEPSQGMRCAFAIGLRTLTLQTGRSFQRDLDLGDDQLAIQVGGVASRELFAYYEALSEQSGSASRMGLLDETSYVMYEGNDRHPVLEHLGDEPGARKLLSAPVLVCTVDHLTPATESLRGGRQIAPMLRLMTGDLVLDEPDDFDLNDLPALTRLVHWAGLLGARVLLSSATLPAALLEGLFMAYLEGRRGFQKNRGARPSEAPSICCLWVDEFNQAHADCADAQGFVSQHLAFAERRKNKLGEQPVRRRAQLLPLPGALRRLGKGERRKHFAAVLRDAAWQLHGQHHSVDPHNGKRVSFGLIRMANIDPLFDVALALFGHGAGAGAHIHLCVYHSQFPLFVRSAIEHRLDTALNRRNGDAVFDLPEMRRIIDAESSEDQLFIVLGSPVTEVGRDHDYDWAVVEPSSMRSLIQLAGRVLRHRHGQEISVPNMLVCNRNLRDFERPGEPAYCRPGFESVGFPLQAHDLDTLLAPQLDVRHRMPVDSRPRLLPRAAADFQPGNSMVDLEHKRMADQMLPSKPGEMPAPRNRLRTAVQPSTPSALNASSFWQREHATLTGFLQQMQPFRDDTRPDIDVVFLPDEDDERALLHRVADGPRKWEKLYVPVDSSLNHPVPDRAVRGAGITPWGEIDLMASLLQQAQEMDMPPKDFSVRYAGASLPDSQQGWRWHPVLGFSGKV